MEGPARDKLMTHRNLNAAATVVASGMALWRAQREQPNAIYLGLGMIGMGILAYTAYLGGQIVYEAGAGVDPAHGVYRPDAPTLRAGRLTEFAGAAATDLAHGVQHMTEELAQGQVIPALTKSSVTRSPAAEQPMPAETAAPPGSWPAERKDEAAGRPGRA